VDVLTEGFDEPRTSAIVVARPTQSVGRYLQMIGRGTRRALGKSDCLIIDVAGNGTQLDERQLLLSSVFPDLVSSGDAYEPHAKSKRRYVCSPSDDRDRAWVRVDDLTFVLDVARNMRYVVRERNDGSGLFDAVLDDRNTKPTRLDGLPIEEVVAIVHDALARRGPSPFALAAARWRTNPASDAAIAMLARLDPTAADHAKGRRWSAGRVSTEITRAIVQRQLPRLFGSARAS
ncbi:MAG: DEAD/DEAH box helicase, partial [Vulcanimicrobiaceae bacterium]